MFLKDDQKPNVRECCVKVACIHFFDGLEYKIFPYNDLQATRGSNKIKRRSGSTDRTDLELSRSSASFSSSSVRVYFAARI